MCLYLRDDVQYKRELCVCKKRASARKHQLRVEQVFELGSAHASARRVQVVVAVGSITISITRTYYKYSLCFSLFILVYYI